MTKGIVASCAERIFDCEFAEERAGTSAWIWNRPRAQAIQGKRTAVFSNMQRSARIPVWRGLDLNTALDTENKTYVLVGSHAPRLCSLLRAPTSHRLASGECRHFSKWHFHSTRYRGSKIQTRRAQAVVEFLRHNLRNSRNKEKESFLLIIIIAISYKLSASECCLHRIRRTTPHSRSNSFLQSLCFLSVPIAIQTIKITIRSAWEQARVHGEGGWHGKNWRHV